MNRKVIPLLLTILTLTICGKGQNDETKNANQSISFNEENWSIQDKKGIEQQMNIVEYEKRKSLHLPKGHSAFLKDLKPKNFVINFDFIGIVAPGLGFRGRGRNNYEYIYYRLMSDNKKDAIQYIPIQNGSLPWQLYNYPKYEAQTGYPKEKLGALDLKYKEYLKTGDINDSLKIALEKTGLSFSTNVNVQPIDENNWRVVDVGRLRIYNIAESGEEIEIWNPHLWVHTKVEVIGRQASIYIEDMDVPKLIVKSLKGNIGAGEISLKVLFADAYFANFSIEELPDNDISSVKSTTEKPHKTYLSKWRLSQKFTKNDDDILEQLDSLNLAGTDWKLIKSDDDDLVNISPFFNETSGSVSLSCTIISESKRSVKMNFDYANHLTMVFNSEIIFSKGLNSENEGRVFVDDTEIELNLAEGKNELIFVVTADDYKQNWGFIAKLECLDGISIK